MRPVHAVAYAAWRARPRVEGAPRALLLASAILLWRALILLWRALILLRHTLIATARPACPPTSSYRQHIHLLIPSSRGEYIYTLSRMHAAHFIARRVVAISGR